MNYTVASDTQIFTTMDEAYTVYERLTKAVITSSYSEADRRKMLKGEM